ncbi:HAD family hydrolase [Sporosarcina sp. BI001-red]|uniref:HAD family hydrolase n=1 Tax=Sporosarcina sp. BI001-red TaxID=2282866 RepID=UPI000E22ED57|nr:HAD family hydrolase [Sporosarcina sp. BI001-red]REB11026.1 HAD family hydrolase [Sporosarcina sp. BI001-red]
MDTNIFTNVDLVIFDFDGTLYEDEDHFTYFAEQLKKRLPEDVQSLFKTEYEKMVAGEHAVTIGKVYDAIHDHIVKIEPIHSTVVNAWNWGGEELADELIQRLYPQPITFDFDTMIAIGDGWWLPNVCAMHFGLQDTQTAYVETKEFMATDQFQLTKIPGLREALLQLKEKKNIVLLTNSQADDVQRLLQNLNLHEIFETTITEAKKPQDTTKHFLELLQKFNIPAEKALSIGDNYINEIAPAMKMGMSAVYIDRYEVEYPEYQGRKVQSISDLINEVNAL